MIITLENILLRIIRENPVKKSRIFGSNTISKYILLETLEVELTNKFIIVIPKGYVVSPMLIFSAQAFASKLSIEISIEIEEVV